MKNNKTSTAQSPKDMLEELRSLVADAEKMVGDSLTEHSDDAVSALRERYEAAQERLADVYSTAKRKVTDGAKYTDEAIRENPYQSIAIAVGVGLLAGVLLGRRSK
ncbi:MAG TPA: hypothetical protein VHO24_20960 [Opitutaceae bacterium]|nr:hypothetical protein [Opitutaceae bacterium]